MVHRLLALLTLALSLAASPAEAVAQDLTAAPPEEAAPVCDGTCVAKEDMAMFIELARERQCLDKQTPTIKIDPVNLVLDKEGRIFYTGGKGLKPFKMKMTWCNYEMEAQGEVKVLAAVQEPAAYGFRFRPKAYTGLLLAEPFRDNRKITDAIDAGLMVDPFFVKDFNLNFHVGFRSVGAGVGMDIFRSFGVYAGYALAWDGFRHNPEAAVWFAFW